MAVRSEPSAGRRKRELDPHAGASVAGDAPAPRQHFDDVQPEAAAGLQVRRSALDRPVGPAIVHLEDQDVGADGRAHADDTTHAAVAPLRRAEAARRRAVAAREAAEQATTEYARPGLQRVADLRADLAVSREGSRAPWTIGPPEGDVRSVETVWLDVERRMRRGERFRDVEDIIDASDLSPEEKSALWLLAWSYVHPRAQRREASAHLAHLTVAPPPPPSRSGRHLRIAGKRLRATAPDARPRPGANRGACPLPQREYRGW